MALSGVAVAVATVALFLTPRLDASVWINDAVTFGLCLLFVGAWLAIRADRLGVAAALVIGAGGGGILATVTIASFAQGLSPLTFVQVASLTIVVVLVGMVGGLRTIVGVAFLLNICTVAILLWAPHPSALDTLIRQQFPLLLSVSLTYQWGVAALMIAIWLSYRQTLQSLGVAYERARQLDNLKAQFITHVNHELRTPIMTLQGYIEYLRLGRQSLPDAEIDASLERASRTADTLVTLLSNILDIRRIETQSAFTPERAPVRDALDAALALIDPRLADDTSRDLHLELSDHLEVWGDPLWLQQILTNLLANALKYSAPGTPLEVSGSVVGGAPTLSRRRASAWGGKPATHPMVEIVVRDHGYGIPPDQAPLLFNRFARLPRDLASTVEGTGLGLYLCRVFTETMGGSIWVESAGVAGEGSAFHIRLPAPTGPACGRNGRAPSRASGFVGFVGFAGSARADSCSGASHNRKPLIEK